MFLLKRNPVDSVFATSGHNPCVNIEKCVGQDYVVDGLESRYTAERVRQTIQFLNS